MQKNRYEVPETICSLLRELGYESTSRPTREEAVTYLRETFHLHVLVAPSYETSDALNSWWYSVANLDALSAREGLYLSENKVLYKTAEEAMDAGLLHILEELRQ